MPAQALTKLKTQGQRRTKLIKPIKAIKRFFKKIFMFLVYL